MANANKSRIQTFFRIVKAESGHRFAGLYAVEKVKYRDGKFLSKEIVHEWDMRIISESILARLGGQDAYENFKMDHEVEDAALDPATVETDARKPEDLDLTQRKLDKELRMKDK